MRTFTPRVQPVRLVAVLLMAGAAAAACGGSSSGGGTTGSGAAPAGKGHTITAVETEFKIALSRTTMPAGTYTFDAENQGHATHALEINGPGVSDKATGNISPGQNASITVTLQPGTYEVWCPVDGHKMLGMDTHITVT